VPHGHLTPGSDPEHGAPQREDDGRHARRQLEPARQLAEPRCRREGEPHPGQVEVAVRHERVALVAVPHHAQDEEDVGHEQPGTKEDRARQTRPRRDAGRRQRGQAERRKDVGQVRLRKRPLRVDRDERARPEEGRQVEPERPARDGEAIAQGRHVQGGGDEANQGDAASDPESDVGGERDPEAAVEAATATPVDQDERRGERHRRPFAEQREDEE